MRRSLADPTSDQSRNDRLGRVFAAVGLAVLGTALAAFAFPSMQQSDAFLRAGVRAPATVVAVDDATCFFKYQRRTEQYPCFKAVGEWTHEGVAYRADVGYFDRRDQVTLGRTLQVVFEPDAAAAAGKAALRYRVAAEGASEPVSERPFYLALLVLAFLMWIPALRVLFRSF